MDTNKENELMQNLERQTPPFQGGVLADGRYQSGRGFLPGGAARWGYQ